MPAFVGGQKQSNKPIPKNFDYELSLLVLAKKTNISFEELSMMTLNEFIKYVDMFIGEEEQVKEATQNDIDAFYRM